MVLKSRLNEIKIVPTIKMMATPRTEKEMVPEALRTFCARHMLFSSLELGGCIRFLSVTVGGPVAYCTARAWSLASDVAIHELTSMVHWLLGNAS